MNNIKKWLIFGLLFGSLYSVYAAGNRGETPLHTAAHEGRLDQVRVLLMDPQADINATDNYGETPIRYAAQSGKAEVVKELCLHKDRIDVNKADIYGLTPLMAAMLINRGDIAETLILAGANVNAKNREGLTAVTASSRPEVIAAIRDVSIKNQIPFTNAEDIELLDGNIPGSYRREYMEFARDKDRMTKEAMATHKGPRGENTPGGIKDIVGKFNG